MFLSNVNFSKGCEKMKIIRGRRTRKFLIAGLLSLLLVMTIGYSAFYSKLDIKGSSMVTSKWDIEITDLQLKQEVGEAENVSYDFDALTQRYIEKINQ